MNPAVSLVLTLLVLHVLEGVYWVRRTAFGFRRGWRRQFSVDAHDGPLGNADHRALILSPLPPLPEIHVVEDWPVDFAEDRVWVGALELSPEQARQAAAEGKEVQAGSWRVRCSSPIAAFALAKTIRRWGEVPADQRQGVLEAHLEQRHDPEQVNARLALYRGATRHLHVIGNLLPWLLIGGTAVFFLVPELSHLGPWALAIGAGLLVVTWVELYRLHKKFYPELTADRAMKVAMVVFSFPAAARARAWLGRDLLADHDPLVVAQVLLEPEAFHHFAEGRWRRLQHPLRSAPEPGRAQFLHHQDRALRRAGLVPDDLLRAPAKESRDAVAYCPRCTAQFREVEGTCADCPGVLRLKFPAS
jgi:hypothetical protein